MTNMELQELNENIITRLKSNQNFRISEKDTLYVYSDEMVQKITEITDEENQISNHLLSLIGSSKNDDEQILISTTPINLYNLLIHFQRIILSHGLSKPPIKNHSQLP